MWAHGPLGCALFFFMQGLCASTWAARIPAIAEALRLSDVTLGWVLLCAPLASLATMPVAGVAVARLGSRPTLRAGALYQALCVCAIGWAPTVPHLVAALLAYGVANTLVQIAVNVQAVATEAHTKQSWMSTFHGLWSVGGFAGAALAAGLIRGGVGPKEHVSVVLAVVLTLFMVGCGRLWADAPHAPHALKKFAKPNAVLWHLGLLAFAAMYCETAMFDWSGMYLGRVCQLPAAVTGTAYAAMMASMAIGRLGADVGVTRYGLTQTLRTGAALTALGLALSIVWPNPSVATLAFVLVGFGLSPIVPLLMGAVGRATDFPPGVALAWASTIGFTGAMAAPPTLGWLSSQVGLRAAFGLPLVFASSLALSLRKSGLPNANPRHGLARPSAIG